MIFSATIQDRRLLYLCRFPIPISMQFITYLVRQSSSLATKIQILKHKITNENDFVISTNLILWLLNIVSLSIQDVFVLRFLFILSFIFSSLNLSCWLTWQSTSWYQNMLLWHRKRRRNFWKGIYLSIWWWWL